MVNETDDRQSGVAAQELLAQPVRIQQVLEQIARKPMLEWTTTELREVDAELGQMITELGTGIYGPDKTVSSELKRTMVQVMRETYAAYKQVREELANRTVYTVSATGEEIAKKRKDDPWYSNDHEPTSAEPVPISRIGGTRYMFMPPPGDKVSYRKDDLGAYYWDDETQQVTVYVERKSQPNLADIWRSNYLQIGEHRLQLGANFSDNFFEQHAVLKDELDALTDNPDMQNFLHLCVTQNCFLFAAGGNSLAFNVTEKYGCQMTNLESKFPSALLINQNPDGSVSIRTIRAFDAIQSITDPTNKVYKSQNGEPLVTVDATYIIRPVEGGGVQIEVGQCSYNIHDERLLERQLPAVDGKLFRNPLHGIIQDSLFTKELQKTEIEQWVAPAPVKDVKLEAFERLAENFEGVAPEYERLELTDRPQEIADAVAIHIKREQNMLREIERFSSEHGEMGAGSAKKLRGLVTDDMQRLIAVQTKLEQIKQPAEQLQELPAQTKPEQAKQPAEQLQEQIKPVSAKPTQGRSGIASFFIGVVRWLGQFFGGVDNKEASAPTTTEASAQGRGGTASLVKHELLNDEGNIAGSSPVLSEPPTPTSDESSAESSAPPPSEEPQGPAP